MVKNVWKGIFIIYILMLLIFIVIKFDGNIASVINTIQSNAEWRAEGESAINLVPFRTIGTYTSNFFSSIAFENILGNIIPFIPMGFIIPMAFPSQRNIIKIMISCLLLICSIETLQFISFLGSFDIDDIILNQLSCLIGFLLFIMCKNVIKVVS
jgi:glycopeptide antibiotics resistance protein